MVRRSYPNRPDLLLPFAFAVFCAAGVAPFVISNPMNLIVAEYAGIGFNDYDFHMVPVSVAGWVSSFVILRAVFGPQLRPDFEQRGEFRAAVPLPPRTKHFVVFLLFTLAGYPALSYAGGLVWPVSTLSAIAAACFAGTTRSHHLSV